MSVVLAASAAFAGLVFVYIFGDPKRTRRTDGQTAYILENVVTHARLLPKASVHDFAYPTLAFLLPLDALESHDLDLARGWLFGYGGTSWRVTGLRSAAYLSPDGGPGRGRRSLKEKLKEVLRQYGHDAERLGEAWVLTMPSYMGYEGINPLTVHYCYEKDEEKGLAWVVLEIHNTFGEKHVHVLTTGVGEDTEDRVSGYEHQWTFARDFHVSPFNDRLGHYRVSVSAPPAPSSSSLKSSPPRPKIRIHLHAPPSSPSSSSVPESDQSQAQVVGPLKLRAVQYARHAVPLTSANLLRAFAQYPLALFLSFARILYHAWILHYIKQLDVFPRPDPKPALRNWADLSSRSDARGGHEGGETQQKTAVRIYGGIGWQDEGPLEAYARKVTERFLRRRASQLGVTVVLASADPSVPEQTFAPAPPLVIAMKDTVQVSKGELIVHYAAPRFFTTLLLAPSAAHMLLLGQTEDLFRVNSESLFRQVFAPPEKQSSFWARRNQSARTSLLPGWFLRSVPFGSDNHPLDDDGGALNLPVMYLLHTADVLEKTIFTSLKARFVPGLEPWRRWERAAVAAGGE